MCQVRNVSSKHSLPNIKYHFNETRALLFRLLHASFQQSLAVPVGCLVTYKQNYYALDGIIMEMLKEGKGESVRQIKTRTFFPNFLTCLIKFCILSCHLISHLCSDLWVWTQPSELSSFPLYHLVNNRHIKPYTSRGLLPHSNICSIVVKKGCHLGFIQNQVYTCRKILPIPLNSWGSCSG